MKDDLLENTNRSRIVWCRLRRKNRVKGKSMRTLEMGLKRIRENNDGPLFKLITCASESFVLWQRRVPYETMILIYFTTSVFFSVCRRVVLSKVKNLLFFFSPLYIPKCTQSGLGVVFFSPR